jgi:glycosyltransferase involved in cell wall biosynthesis
MGNRKIDIIIPAYNVADNILFRCLSSIACQTIVEDLEITIVDDASTKYNYNNVIKNFESILKINLLRYETNGGPGVARQYGLDHTSNEYITFIDADDTFNGAYALDSLRIGIEMENGVYQMCVGVFDEMAENNNVEDPEKRLQKVTHSQDMVWMFGKLYRRDFINKYNIRFHPTSRANEDNGFNTICKLCINNVDEKIHFITSPVYYWHDNPNSITRINNCQYTYGGSTRDSFYGYVENMIYAIKTVRANNINKELIDDFAIDFMVRLYEYYIECYARARQHADNNFLWCKTYYDEIYSDLDASVPYDTLVSHYNDIMTTSYAGGNLTGIIPVMSIFEFFEKLRKPYANLVQT